MVNVVIMRHGEAQPQAADDSQRTLTAQGQAEVKQVAAWLAEHYAAFDYIWVSPYIRTQQTAALMLEAQPAKCKLLVNAGLVPEGMAGEILDQYDLLLAEQPEARVLMVSHMPLVSFLVEAFTQPGQAPIFSTAALSCIDYNPTRGGRLAEQHSPLDLPVL